MPRTFLALLVDSKIPGETAVAFPQFRVATVFISHACLFVAYSTKPPQIDPDLGVLLCLRTMRACDTIFSGYPYDTMGHLVVITESPAIKMFVLPRFVSFCLASVGISWTSSVPRVKGQGSGNLDDYR